MSELLDRLREVGCDREPFTPDHAECICRLTNKAAEEIDRMRSFLAAIASDGDVEHGSYLGPDGHLRCRRLAAQGLRGSRLDEIEG